MAERPGPTLKDLKRFLVKAAFVAPLILPGVGHAQQAPESDPNTEQVAAETDTTATTIDQAVSAEQAAPVQVPAETSTSKLPYQDISPFASNKPIFKGKELTALEKYLGPFDSIKFGETTDAELLKILGPSAQVTKKGQYTVYSLPLPPSNAQELNKRYLDPAKRPNEVVTRNGVAFMERINGFAPDSLIRVPNSNYTTFLGHAPDSTTYGHSFWGNSLNNFYQDRGLVTITSAAPMGADADQINEYVKYDPRLAGGGVLSADEFKQIYADINGQEFDYNPNTK